MKDKPIQPSLFDQQPPQRHPVAQDEQGAVPQPITPPPQAEPEPVSTWETSLIYLMSFGRK